MSYLVAEGMRREKKERIASRSETGRRGEDEACIYLENLGHSIIARNWRGGRVELDIISLGPDGLHFVEVKSRTAPCQAPPEVNVNYAKRRNIVSAAGRFLATAGRGKFGDVEIFFDVITVVFDGPSANVEYFPAAFIPMYY